MRYLAKLGFSQSYTYFTWRNTKRELTEKAFVADLVPERLRGTAFGWFHFTPAAVVLMPSAVTVRLGIPVRAQKW